MDKDFTRDNEDALLEEIGEHLNIMTEITQQCFGTIPKGRADPAFLRNCLMAISQSLGYTVAIFNQFMVFRTGKINREKPATIGFGRFFDKEKD